MSERPLRVHVPYATHSSGAKPILEIFPEYPVNTVIMTARTPNLSELSGVIGELRNFAAAQINTNEHMLEELKKISDRLSGLGELGATFTAYRGTLHERFGKIHDQMANLDETDEKVIARLDRVEQLVSNWQSNWKLLVIILTPTITLLSAIISAYGTSIVRALMR